MVDETGPKKLEPRDRAEWRAWLEKNHDRVRGVLLVTRKKGSRLEGVRYEEAVEEAVSYGWIDSRVNRLDDDSFLQLYTPRKAGSGWSRSNKARVAKLTEQGRMAPPGIEKVEAARRDGSWNRLDRAEAMKLPADLREALKEDELAAKNFKRLADSTKKQMIFWIESAKRVETRQRRVAKVVESAKTGRPLP
jgi:uncharacterized protein YdeI (YjbR/CyaY-like superfamily)